MCSNFALNYYLYENTFDEVFQQVLCVTSPWVNANSGHHLWGSCTSFKANLFFYSKFFLFTYFSCVHIVISLKTMMTQP